MRMIAALLTAMLAGAPAAALAAPAGNALGVRPAADAALSGETRTLVVGADVFIGDLIKTGPKGQVQILFADNTELVVGPSSALLIEDYLIRNDGSAGKLAVDMLSGAFRFATGDSAKNRYTIGTPTGTIGVRGTEFDVWVDAQTKSSYVLRHGGTVEICSNAGECELLSDICEVGKIAGIEAEVIGDSRLSKGELRQQLKSWFIYTDNQSPLLRQFWFPAARECLNSSPVAPAFPDTEDGLGEGGQIIDDQPGRSQTPPPPPPPPTGQSLTRGP